MRQATILDATPQYLYKPAESFVEALTSMGCKATKSVSAQTVLIIARFSR